MLVAANASSGHSPQAEAMKSAELTFFELHNQRIFFILKLYTLYTFSNRSNLTEKPCVHVWLCALILYLKNILGKRMYSLEAL